AAVSSASCVLADMPGLAVSVVNTVSGPDAKRAAAQQVDQAIRQMLDTANQQFRDRYLFAGSQTTVRPFTAYGTAVRYNGNQHDLLSYSDVDLLFATNVHGDAIFGGLSHAIQGYED